MTVTQVFDLCEHVKKDYPKRKLFIKCLCILFGPIMPVIILANYIFYKEQEHAYKRELQTHGSLEHDLKDDDPNQSQRNLILEEQGIDKDSDAVKVSLFRKIQIVRYKAALNRRIYSYFRVVQASIESFIGNKLSVMALLVNYQ